jgi:hypothetical protein
MDKDFISDSEMQQLESAGHAKAVRPKMVSPDFVSDDEMGQFEKSGKAQMPSAKSDGAGQAFLESYGNAATMGYLPHLQAATAPAMEWALDKLTGNNAAGGDTYIQRRDANITHQEQQRQDHPIATKAGTVAGVVGGGLITGAALPAAAPTVIGRIAQGAKAGAAMGAAANPGDEEGDFSPLQIEKRLINALVGGGTGAAAAGAVEGVKALAPIAGKYFGNKAEEKAISAIGAKGKARERLVSPEGGSDTGRVLLDEGTIPILGTPKRIGARVEAAKEVAGKEVGELVRNTQGAPGIDSTAIGVKILNSPRYAALRKTPGMEGLADRVDKLVDTLSNNGVMSLEQTQALRQAVDKSINFSKSVPELRGIQPILYDIRTELRDSMNHAINVSGQAGKDALLSANRRFGRLADASMTVGKKIAQDAGNRSFSLTDTIATGAGATAGGPLAAMAAGAANKAARTFGDSVAARGLNAASKVFNATPSLTAFAEKNPMLFQTVVSKLTPKAGPSATREPAPWENQQLMDIFRSNEGLVDNIQDKRTREEIRKRLKRKPARQ